MSNHSSHEFIMKKKGSLKENFDKVYKKTPLNTLKGGSKSTNVVDKTNIIPSGTPSVDMNVEIPNVGPTNVEIPNGPPNGEVQNVGPTNVGPTNAGATNAGATNAGGVETKLSKFAFLKSKKTVICCIIIFCAFMYLRRRKKKKEEDELKNDHAKLFNPHYVHNHAQSALPVKIPIAPPTTPPSIPIHTVKDATLPPREIPKVPETYSAMPVIEEAKSDDELVEEELDE